MSTSTSISRAENVRGRRIRGHVGGGTMGMSVRGACRCPCWCPPMKQNVFYEAFLVLVDVQGRHARQLWLVVAACQYDGFGFRGRKKEVCSKYICAEEK